MQDDELSELLKHCESEPLHRSGAIQAYGALLAWDAGSGRISHCSENLAAFWGQDSPPAVGAPVTRWASLQSVYERLLDQPERKRLFVPLLHRGPGGYVDGVAWRDAGACIAELQPSNGDTEPADVSGGLLKLLMTPGSAEELQDYCAEAARMMRQLTGFPQALVYRFLEDGTGEVVGEDREAAMPEYLGLRFPASDIPGNARRLYLLNEHRSIPDATAPMVAVCSSADAAPLDLTYSDVRSVSPVHIEYMHNMGVTASLSLAVKVGGELWGLITAHNRKPCYLSYEQRLRCLEIARSFGLGVMGYASAERMRFIDEVDRRIERLLGGLDDPHSPLLNRAAEADDALLSLVGAQGAALVLADDTRRYGVTPGPAELERLDAWFAGQEEELFHSDSLARQLPEADAYRAAVSGVLACRARRPGGRGEARFYWFRSEQPRHVHWAGNPEKRVVQREGLGHALSPRTSFARWTELKQGVSAPWSLADLMAAKKFRSALLRWQ